MDIVVRREGDDYTADWGAGPRNCAVGRSGIGQKLREGDGLTPAGSWPLRRVLYRADRMPVPKTGLPVSPIEPDDAWCDVPGDPNYNQAVRLPYPSLDERLWRQDSLYDLIVVVGFNDDPAMPGKGSAIFVHVARPDYSPTQGCVALARDDLIEAVAQLGPTDELIVEA
ncbi:MAG TPA: L,D-transpeptidase family protein [Micropepsaceae bacterium]|jgi:L,D-peptidoglycan transpeptidase YkuD (ErfK/YbiS/YcfS/YnhG family)|nr:L,D-transpeptidase family protein [Micropepsaceae bacterium]